MTSIIKPTAAQMRYLRHLAMGREQLAAVGPQRFNDKTVESCIGRGWARRASVGVELTDAGRALLLADTAADVEAAEWAPRGTAAVQVAPKLVSVGDQVLVHYGYGNRWALSSAFGTQRYSEWAPVVQRRGRTLFFRTSTGSVEQSRMFAGGKVVKRVPLAVTHDYAPDGTGLCTVPVARPSGRVELCREPVKGAPHDPQAYAAYGRALTAELNGWAAGIDAEPVRELPQGPAAVATWADAPDLPVATLRAALRALGTPEALEALEALDTARPARPVTVTQAAYGGRVWHLVDGDGQPVEAGHHVDRDGDGFTIAEHPEARIRLATGEILRVNVEWDRKDGVPVYGSWVYAEELVKGWQWMQLG